uniref:Transmembrane transporter n=1 Tax=Solanum tuberosum TaxID=4113 RepID=M1C645_SOLTU
MATACITIMPVPICLASCKPHSSLDTWLASAMVSSSCSGLLVSVQPYFLSVIYTGQSSASRKQVRRFSVSYRMLYRCGRAIWYPRRPCRILGSLEMMKHVLSYTGKLRTFFLPFFIYSLYRLIGILEFLFHILILCNTIILILSSIIPFYCIGQTLSYKLYWSQVSEDCIKNVF